MKKTERAMLKIDGYFFEVRVMARAEGYVMVRRKGCMPFVVDAKQIMPIFNDQGQPTA